MNVPSDPRKNRLLATLPHGEWLLWAPLLECVAMNQGQLLHDAGRAVSHAWFPTTAVVSLMYVMEDGVSPEVATVGNEGMVGISLYMGSDSTPSREVVLSGGHGFRMPAHSFRNALKGSPGATGLMLRYTQALMTQMGRTGVCNRHHSPAQQFCRWLLLNHDRIPGDELVMTQELIANTLGVRREVINDVALKLQDAGVIRYKRGHIEMLDRHGLESRACECYAAVRKEYDRLLPAMTDAGGGAEDSSDSRSPDRGLVCDFAQTKPALRRKLFAGF